MKGTSKTRTQRRMEKRQAVILLVLVLVVSLASFTLGVVVGRRGAERDLTQKFQQTERVLVAQTPVRDAAPPATPDPNKSAEVPAVDVAQDETKLSFYDDLAKETVPLGSGINLAPIEEKKPDVVAQPPIDLPDRPIIKKEMADVTATSPQKQTVASIALPDKASSAAPGSGLPKAVAEGSHAVQIGSFGIAGDAIALKQDMVRKGYPAFVVEADLGKKGLWYRVRIGPYKDSAVATSAQKFLEEKEKIKSFITRQ